jgi:hypothetical protein
LGSASPAPFAVLQQSVPVSNGNQANGAGRVIRSCMLYMSQICHNERARSLPTKSLAGAGRGEAFPPVMSSNARQGRWFPDQASATTGARRPAATGAHRARHALTERHVPAILQFAPGEQFSRRARIAAVVLPDRGAFLVPIAPPGRLPCHCGAFRTCARTDRSGQGERLRRHRWLNAARNSRVSRRRSGEHHPPVLSCARAGARCARYGCGKALASDSPPRRRRRCPYRRAPAGSDARASIGIITSFWCSLHVSNRATKQEERRTMIKIIVTIALAGALAACTVGQPANRTAGGVEGGSSGAVIGCLVTIPIGCAPGAVVGGVAGGTLGATGHAVPVTPPPPPPSTY